MCNNCKIIIFKLNFKIQNAKNRKMQLYCEQSEKNKILDEKSLKEENNGKELNYNLIKAQKQVVKKRKLQESESTNNKETENKNTDGINEPFLLINHLKICKFL